MKFKYTSLILILVIFSQASRASSFYGLFGDITVTDSNNQSQNSDPVTAVLDFYLVHQFAENFSVLIEYVFDKSAHHTKKHTERFSLKYAFSQQFSIAAGRFHTPLGGINQYEHHGSLLQAAVNRPFFLEFHESTTTMPLHVVGFMASGVFHKNRLNIGYEATLHSNQHITTASHGSNQAEIKPNDHLSGSIEPGYSFRTRIFPDKNNRQIGVFFYRNNTEFDLNNEHTSLEEIIAGLDIRYTIRQWELTAEIFNFTHDYQTANKKYKATAYFTQAEYTYSDSIKLIYRYTDMNIDEADKYYQIFAMHDQKRHSMTLRHDLNYNHAVKLELEHINYADTSAEDSTVIRTQWSFLFH
jgi:hypothetical protein